MRQRNSAPSTNGMPETAPGSGGDGAPMHRRPHHSAYRQSRSVLPWRHSGGPVRARRSWGAARHCCSDCWSWKPWRHRPRAAARHHRRDWASSEDSIALGPMVRLGTRGPTLMLLMVGPHNAAWAQAPSIGAISSRTAWMPYNCSGGQPGRRRVDLPRHLHRAPPASNCGSQSAGMAKPTISSAWSLAISLVSSSLDSALSPI